MYIRHALLVSRFAALTAVACGRGTGNTTDDGISGTGYGSDDSGFLDVSRADGSRSPAYLGTVTLDETMEGSSGTTTTTQSVGASFFAADGGRPENVWARGVAAQCQGTMSGKCCYAPAMTAGPVPAPVSAGRITVTQGGNITLPAGRTIATLTPVGATYAPTVGTTLWPETDSDYTALYFSVWGAGDTVQAFSGGVYYPGQFGTVAPALSDAVAMTIDRTKDFTLTWTGGGAEVVSLTIVALNAGTPDGSIVCPLYGGSNASVITVPATLLASFLPTDTAIVTLSASVAGDSENADAIVTVVSTASTRGLAKFQ